MASVSVDEAEFAAALKRKGMTCTDLARETGLSRNTILAIRAGKKCAVTSVEKVAGALGPRILKEGDRMKVKPVLPKSAEPAAQGMKMSEILRRARTETVRQLTVQTEHHSRGQKAGKNTPIADAAMEQLGKELAEIEAMIHEAVWREACEEAQ